MSLLSTPVTEVAKVFLKLGFTAFGGPAAHVAMMREEVVRKRGWLTEEEFLDALSATNFIPGPNSTEMALHVGLVRAGMPGLIMAGACFILPAALIVSGFAWAYVRFGTLPAAHGVLYGVKPVIIAVVALALWNLGKSALKSRWLAFLAVTALFANALGVNELAVIAGAGFAAALAAQPRQAVLAGIPLSFAATAPAPFSLAKLTLFFLKVGSVLFGSGYVLIAYLRGDLVEKFHWLTETQLLDAVAVGQFTPGPVFTTATFIGYVLAGPKGAALATAAIFLPAFFFVAVSGRLLPRLRRSKIAAAALDGVNAASLAVMAVATAWLARNAIPDAWAAGLAIIAFLLLARFRLNSAWLVAAGGLTGFLFS
jgi:chromate transporter